MTLLERAAKVSRALERLHIAANEVSKPPRAGMEMYDRMKRSEELSEAAVAYTRVLEAFAKGGAS